MSSVSDEVLEITINNSETPSKTPSGKADSRGGEGERGGRGRGEEEKEREGGKKEGREEGQCEEALPKEAKAVDTTEHSEEQTKQTMTDDNEQVLNCSTGGREGEREVAERKREEDESQRVGYDHQSNVEHEEPAHDTGTAAAGHEGDAAGHEGDAGTKTKSPIHLSNKLMFALD